MSGSDMGRLAASFTLSIAASFAIPSTEAAAACVQSGSTVTCSGASSTGFGTGVEDNIALTVQPDAIITVGHSTAINLRNGNTATNNGTIAVGGGGIAMQGIDNNTITNTGTITLGVNSSAMSAVGTGNVFANSGTINSNSNNVSGFSVLGDGNTLTNSGTISLTGWGVGLFLASNGNTVVNSGAIAEGGSTGKGVFLLNGNTFTNTGTITLTGTAGIGAELFGDGNTVSNGGTISATGAGSHGIYSSGTGSAITNSGVIMIGGSTVGAIDSAGVLLFNASTLGNTGSIIATGTNGVGVDVFGDGNTVTNGGTISATGTNASALLIEGINNTIVNNGTIKGGVNGYALLSFGTTGATITNNGTLDGRIFFPSVANSLTNAGLLTITDAATALGIANFGFGGSFTQTAQGTLALRVDNAGQHDGLSAEQASLNGSLRAVLQSGLYQSTTTYANILQTTGAVSGQFSSVMSSSAFFNATATYNASSVDLTLTRLGFGAVAGETSNQRAVGNALEAGYSTALTGTAATFYANLLQAGSVRVLDQLSGEGTSGTQTTAFSVGRLFGDTLDGQMAAWRAGNRGTGANDNVLGYADERPTGAASAFNALKAPAMVQPGWNVWASGFGASQSLSGNAVTGSAGFSDRAAGGALGLDHQVNPDLLVGIAIGGSSASFAVDDRATNGRLEGGHIGAYAMQRFGAAYVSAQLAYSHFSNSTTRTITGIGADEIAKGSFGSDQLGGRLEIGRGLQYGRLTVTPYAAIQAAQLWQAAYTEASTAGGAPGVLGLSFAARSVSSLPAFLGTRFDGRVELGNGMIWSPFGNVAWVHEFSPTRDVTAALINMPAPSFTVEGARAASDSGRVELGSGLALNRWAEVSARVTGEFSHLGQSYSGMGAFKVSW